MLDRFKREHILKELLRNIISLWSYWFLRADIADMASRHNNTHRFFPSFSRHFSIAQTIVDIIISIFMQKSKATDRYWWRIGLAKLDVATACLEARTRRAISSSISAPLCRMIHQNVAHDVVYRRANWDSDMTFLFTLFHSNSRTLWTSMSIRHHATSKVERYRSRGRKGSGPLRAELILWGVFEILRRR